MPRIWNSQVQSQGYLQHIPDNSLQQIGQTLQALGEKKRRDNMAIDLAEFQKEQISVMEQIQNTGSHDTAQKKDMIGGEVVSEGIPKTYMRQFSEKASKLKKMYPEAEDTLSQYEVSQFGKITNLYSSMKVTADVDYFSAHVTDMSERVKNGSISKKEAYITSAPILDGLFMPAETRSNAKQSMIDYLSMSDFDYTLRTNPMRALNNLDSEYFRNDTMPVSMNALQQMNNDADRYVNARAMSEISSANESASMLYKHKPDYELRSLLIKRKMPEQLAAVKSAQAQAEARDAVSSGNLMVNAAALDQRLRAAILANDVEATKQTLYLKDAVTKTAEGVKAEPETMLTREGVPVEQIQFNPADPSDFLANRIDVKSKAEGLFGTPASLFGSQGNEVVQVISNTNIAERPMALANLSSRIPEQLKSTAVKELAGINPSVGVSMALLPAGASMSVTQSRLPLIKDILTPADKNFLPEDSNTKAWVMGYFGGVEVGDRAGLIPAITSAANNAAAARFARENIQPKGGSSEYKEILEGITGKHLSFGGGKALNFQLPDGSWADPNKAVSGLNAAIESGMFAPNGVSKSDMKSRGILVPTSENGVYKMKRKDIMGEQYYSNPDGSHYLFDLNKSYNTQAAAKSLWSIFE